MRKKHLPSVDDDPCDRQALASMLAEAGLGAGSVVEPTQVAAARPPIEVVVIDDHPPVRQGLELLLPRQGFRIIGSAAGAAAGARMIRARRPAVALVDIDLGDGSGTALATAVHDEGLATAIVLYTGSTSSTVIDAAVDSGAAVVLKSSPIEHVADAIRAAAAGRVYVDPSLTAAARRPRGGRGPIRITSAREAQILGMLACGLTTRRIADELFLSPETVQTHIRNATRKLGASGRLHAVVLAGDRGEIDLPRARR